MHWYIIDSFNYIDVQQKKSQALKAITRSDGFFEKHYPLYPVLPETIQIEMIAQTGGVLAGALMDFKKEVVLGKIDSAEFDEIVQPPALLTIDAWAEDVYEEGTRIRGEVSSAGKIVGKASILLIHIDKLQTKQLASEEAIVFNEDFLNTLHVRDLLKAAPK